MSLRICQMELRTANEFIAEHHRHHKPVQGHRFSIGVVDATGALRGVAVVGRPVSRGCNPREVLEVTRLATDGARNACSMLYACAAKVGRLLGYEKIQTYILDSEDGTTLRAAGWCLEATTAGGQWHRPDGSPRRTDQPTCKKQRWSRALRDGVNETV